MDENTGYNTFFGLVNKSTSILLEFFEKLYNYKQQIKDYADDIDLSNFSDESIAFFRDYIKDGGRLDGVIMNNAESEIIHSTIKQYEVDEKNLSKDDLMKKYKLKENESFSIPLVSYSKDKNNTIMMLRDSDVANLTLLMKYITNHKELYNNIEFDNEKNGEKLFNDYFVRNNIEKITDDLSSEKIELIFDTKKQKDLITNEMQSIGIKFQINNHINSVGVVFNKMQKLNGKDYTNVKELISNNIREMKALTNEEQAKLLITNMKSLNSRENSVKEMEKTLDEKGR